jgi:hypothetical protein
MAILRQCEDEAFHAMRAPPEACQWYSIAAIGAGRNWSAPHRPEVIGQERIDDQADRCLRFRAL